MRKKMIAMLCVCAMLISPAVPMMTFAATMAGVQSDGTFLIADFSDPATCTAWGKGPQNNFDGTQKGTYLNGRYCTDWQMNSGGDYMKNEAAAFSGLDFSDYKYLEFSFNLNAYYENKLQVSQINNWITVVLSTGESAGDYDTYKKNECLVYEIDLSQYTIPASSEGLNVDVSVPLSNFVTQFDGMVNGTEVAEKKDEQTSLSDIKSISILGAGMGISKVGGTTGHTKGDDKDNVYLTFKNEKYASQYGCAVYFKRLSLSKGDASKIKAVIDAQMANYRIVSSDITLPASVDGYPGNIAWTSSHPAIIAADGSYTQPQSNTVVTLTATITADDTTTATATYYVGVKGSAVVQNRTIVDFSLDGVGQAWQDSSVYNEGHMGIVGSIAYEYGKNGVYVPTGGGYLANHPEQFADLDFSDYKGLRLNIWSDRYENVNENYFTVILSTAKDPKGKYTNDECAMIEVDIRSLPMSENSSIYLPFSAFCTEFDGMSGGVQGTADGKTDFSKIQSISIFPGAAKSPNAWSGTGATSDNFHDFFDWAFKNKETANMNSCLMSLYSIDLLTEEPSSTLALYKADGTAFEDLTAAAEVYGKVTLSAVPKDTEIYTVTALYDAEGQLVDVGFEKKTVGNGDITTPKRNYDPAKHKKAAAFIWDTDFTPLVTEAIKTK